MVVEQATSTQMTSQPLGLLLRPEAMGNQRMPMEVKLKRL